VTCTQKAENQQTFYLASGSCDSLPVFSSRYVVTCAGMVALVKEVVEEIRYTPLSPFQYLVS
jgi:hypothetical protein